MLFKSSQRERKEQDEQVGDWLSQQDAYTLHKPARRHYRRSWVIVPGIDAHFQVDLMDLQNLSRYYKRYMYRYLQQVRFNVILKKKQGQELVKAFPKILSTGRKPTKLQTDQGTEFLNRVCDNNIDFFTENSGLKASVVESFNRTFNNKMYKYSTAHRLECYCLLWHVLTVPSFSMRDIIIE